MVGRHNHDAWATCNAFARSTGKPCRRKVAVGEDGRPRPRCLGHGGHVKSGKQTVEGRKRIAEAVSKRMRAFWSEWRAAGRPPHCHGVKAYGRPAKAKAAAASA
jgi:hypothetical protein